MPGVDNRVLMEQAAKAAGESSLPGDSGTLWSSGFLAGVEWLLDKMDRDELPLDD